MYEYAPTDWQIRKLGDFATPIYERFSEDIDAPILSMTKHSGFVKSLEYFSKQIFSNDISNYKLVKKGDFAYATIHLDEGSIGLLKNFKNGYISPMYTVFRVDSTVDKDYLFLLLKTKSYLYKYDALGEGTVNRRKSVKFTDLCKLKIPLPPLPEQQKITTIFSNIGNLIANTQKIIDQSILIKKGMMKKLLTKGIDHKKFKKVKILFGKKIEIPEEWCFKPISKILKITMGQSPPSESYNEENNGLPFFQGTTDFGAIYPNPTIWCTDPKKTAKENSILFSVRAPVGETNLTTTKCCLGRGVASLYPEKNNLLYCFYLINQNKNTFLVYSQGTTYDAINRDDMASVELPFTNNVNEQKKIASVLSNIDSQTQSQTQYKEKLERLKKSLMQKLLTGKMRVKT